MRINRHDTNGTKPLLGKGELGYDDYTAGGDVGRVYVGTGAENIALAERLEANLMTKAQFNALAEERKANRAGSGWDEMGKHSVGYSSVNNGIICSSAIDYINAFQLGWNFTSQLAGDSKTNYLIANVNGVLHKLFSINRSTTSYEINKILLPTAPNIFPYDTVLTTEQINSGVIKHADASNSGLIANGKFDTDASGWSAQGGNSISFDATNGINSTGCLKSIYSSGSLYAYYNLLNLIVGKTYTVEVNFKSSSSASVTHQVALTNWDSPAVYSGAINVTTSYSSFKFTFVASSTSMYYRFYGTMGVSIYLDNIAVYPADAISRSDLVFLESWHEDVSEKNFVYPLGNTQYLGGNTDGLTGIANGSFSGFETYSLFGNWQTPSALIGKGYVWSSLTEAQKKAFISNPENNCYLDGDKTIQVRYRVRVIQGVGDSWTKVSPESVNSNDARYSTLNYTDGVTKYVQLKGKTVALTSDIGSTIQNGFFVTKDKASFYDSVDNGLWIGAKGTNTILDNTSAYEGKCFALPIALISRKNQGMYHPTYNPNGSKKASDDNFWYNTAVSFTSISDCFDPAKLLTASGYIGSVSGRPNGLFYDQVHEGDITDLRNSSKKIEDYNRLIGREFNKLVAGTTRGKEGEIEFRKEFSSTFNYVSTNQFGITTNIDKLDARFGDGYGRKLPVSNSMVVENVTRGLYVVVEYYGVFNRLTIPSFSSLSNWVTGDIINVYITKNTTRTKSNTLLHCDIIGNPTNYPTSWKQSGVFGTPLIVAEDGTSLLPDGVKDTFKLSRKANATPLLCLRSTDSGATWTSFTPTFSTTTNAITLTDEPAGNLVMVYYQTHTSMAVPVVNSEVLEIGDVVGIAHYDTYAGNCISSSLLGKVYGGFTPYINWDKGMSNYRINMTTMKLHATAGYEPTHNTINTLGNVTNPSVKILPYLTRTNGKAYLNLVFKEMKHNGTSWGDDNKFNIVDNVSTTTDNNAQTVLVGQKTVELPYFIAGDE